LLWVMSESCGGVRRRILEGLRDHPYL
jgi:hypothetical protein